MKKFVALGIAVIMLLFGFAAIAEVNNVETELTLCEDIKPWGNPRDISETEFMS